MANGTCSIDGCDRPVLARGWCNRHYLRWRNHGDPLGGAPFRDLAVIALDHRGPWGGCWEWTGCRDESGYGFVGKNGRTHRVAYEAVYGPIPDEMCVLHHCDNPPCWRPDHLFLGDRDDNAKDRVAKDRGRRGETISWSVLTADDVRAIRQLFQDGHGASAIARTFGCSRGAVSAIKAGRSWAWLDGVLL